MLNQMDVMLPPDMKEPAKEAIMACKDVRKCIEFWSLEFVILSIYNLSLFNIEFNYKDPCDRTYYSTKCIFDYNPPLFMFP